MIRRSVPKPDRRMIMSMPTSNVELFWLEPGWNIVSQEYHKYTLWALSIWPKIPIWISGNFLGHLEQNFSVDYTRVEKDEWLFSLLGIFQRFRGLNRKYRSKPNAGPLTWWLFIDHNSIDLIQTITNQQECRKTKCLWVVQWVVPENIRPSSTEGTFF